GWSAAPEVVRSAYNRLRPCTRPACTNQSPRKDRSAMPPASPESETTPATSRPGALDGLRVLDLATFIAGPFCGGLMAEYGADVVKVEQPGLGDSLRELGHKANGRALFWALEARGRRSITLNLREPRGQALALQLIERSDIVIENFLPGTLERW